MRTSRLAPVVLTLAVTLAACSGDGASSSTPSSTVSLTTAVEAAPAPATPTPGRPTEDTAPTTAAQSSETCLTVASRAIRLANSFRANSRGIAPPDPAEEQRIIAEGQAILDQARALGCPIPAAVEQFLSSP